MTETKAQYKLYELSDRISEIEECLELLEGVDIPHDLHQDYLGLLDELKQTEDGIWQRTLSKMIVFWKCRHLKGSLGFIKKMELVSMMTCSEHLT